MIILEKRHIILLHEHLIDATGGSHGLRDEGLLDSAAASPFQEFGDYKPYPSIQQKAARLCFGLIKNHPFVDGNKRIGVHVMLVLLQLNHISLEYTQDELSNVILALAAGEIGYDELLQWVLTHQSLIG